MREAAACGESEYGPTPGSRDAMALPDDDGEAWLILYEDTDREYELFSGCGATKAAHRRFEQLLVTWNCHLFRRVAPPKEHDPRDASIGTDVSDAAIADATIARLCAELEAARLAFRELLDAHDELWRPLPKSTQQAVWTTMKIPSDAQIRHYKATQQARAVLAKLAKGDATTAIGRK
jgi:hypothetical protein